MLGNGGYLLELERRGYVDSRSEREKVGTGRGSGQYTPEVAIEKPEALRELHREFLNAGAQVLQALTFFGTREGLSRGGTGPRPRRSMRRPYAWPARWPATAPSSPDRSRARNSSSVKGRRPRATRAICWPSRSASCKARASILDPRDVLPPGGDEHRAGVRAGQRPALRRHDELPPRIRACSDGYCRSVRPRDG